MSRPRALWSRALAAAKEEARRQAQRKLLVRAAPPICRDCGEALEHCVCKPGKEHPWSRS